MSEQPAPHLRAVAEVLLDLSRDIEALGAALCASPEVLQRHMHELQAIDLIAQQQRSLAAVLRADCAHTALSQIGLEELRDRLGALIEAGA